jgi:hypothetical protein
MDRNFSRKSKNELTRSSACWSSVCITATGNFHAIRDEETNNKIDYCTRKPTTKQITVQGNQQQNRLLYEETNNKTDYCTRKPTTK